MANIKVLLYDQAGTEYDVSYIQEIPMSLNLLIADVRNPEKRNTTFSKTIVFPATKEINRFFRLIFRINTDVSGAGFNPNLKCGIYYYIDSVEQLRGDLQLLKINVDTESGAATTYETSATGRLGNLFLNIGDAYMNALDISEYNHTLNQTNVVNSWATSYIKSGVVTPFAIGEGYTYPLIDFGFNGGSYTDFYVKDLRPIIPKKVILDKIFAAAGKTYTSTYFNSTLFKSQYLEYSPEALTISTSDQNNSQFYARRNANQTGGTDTLTYSSGAWNLFGAGTNNVILFNEDNVAPYNDAGSQYSTGTGVFTVGSTNNYNLTSILKFDLTVSNASADHMQIISGVVRIVLEKWNGSAWVLIGINTDFVNAVYPGLVVSNHEIAVTLSANLIAGEQYRISTYPYNLAVGLFDISNVPVTTGTTTSVLTIKTNSTYYASLQSTVITEGYTVEMNQILPENIKQIDWLMTEFKAANLYMDVDKTNDNNYIIEPREDFYSGEVDWSDELDISMPHEVLPMADLDFKRREFAHKNDADYYNDTYFNEYKEVYGFKYLDITNDFVKGVNKTELIYSPTPTVGNSVNGLVIPKIYKIDSGTIKPTKANLRELYYGGVINLSFGSWTLKSVSGDTTYTTYPYAGMEDNPYNPTFTLLWNTPHKVYYNYPTAAYTDNNRFNKYYSRHINQTTDPNSRIVKAWFSLTKKDIKEFDFRKTVYVGHPLNAYFYVNSIKDYDVLNPKSTEVELLKLQDYAAFTPSNIALPEQIPTGTQRIMNGNTSNGTNNNNYGSNSRISGGSGNYIAPGADGIELINCTGVVVNGDVTSFIGIGLNTVNIDNTSTGSVQYGLDYNPNKLRTTTVTANFNIDGSYDLYYVDCTAGNITATFNTPDVIDFPVTLKRIDATINTLSITGSLGGEKYDGNVTPYNLGLASMKAVEIIGNGTDLFSTDNN